MSVVFIGHGVQDYSKFAAGVPVLVRTDEWEHMELSGPVAVYAGRLRDAYSPRLALLMHDGPLAANFPAAREATVAHLLTGRRSAHEGPDGLQIFTRPGGPTTRALTVMIDTVGIVERIESKPLVWPEHLQIAGRIEAHFTQTFRDHGETLKSLLYR